ncbi:transcription factor IIA, alpha/beta subunit [Pseudovirgaria hyperparasitica]|uniref:Transcription factor IIA, alpha/beta subunit n=1 Tax=Pseudovirgaria hyperparasitica TaxID=470096 RepID=A0A6A6WAW9_9PEZI|nr:transcription factor IIA, alpha/beta subunit [Pseudovirgaria hyperparasitica]KAF2758737.1 transcription factor IIA, alpha/beta subunit [Pseudovirgaria hyperparasitica]
MSNGIVGATYQAIIAKVIEASENDFLENGVDQSLLHEMREGWQKRLTDLKGANYPWDPTPPQPINPPTVPSNGPKPEQSTTSMNGQQPGQRSNYTGPQIKQEMKQEDGLSNLPSQEYPPPVPTYRSGLDRNVAQQRAADLLQRDFGSQAAQSIAAIPTQANGQQRPQHIQMPPQNQQQQMQRMQQHLQQQAQQQRQQQLQQLQAQNQQRQQQQSNVYQAQHDGAGDEPMEWTAHLAAMHSQGESSRMAADAFLQSQIDSLSASMDSGLLVPLDEIPASRRSKLKKAVKRRAAWVPSQASSSEPRVPQLDGIDDDDDDDDEKKIPDDEAINSDLDDSEDELNEADDDSQDIGDIMLCTYDKVQRVKNKWKCTLKDGILTTNGKDYLFHKATGEFEW